MDFIYSDLWWGGFVCGLGTMTLLFWLFVEIKGIKDND